MKQSSMAIFAAVCMMVSLAACGTAAGDPPAATGPQATQPVVTAPSSSAPDAETQPEPETPAEAPAETPKALVAYFSATGTTGTIAGYIAQVLDADLYEIMPETPYTEADLDYRDPASRSSVEMNDSAARPDIAGTVENMEDYDIVFLGYPIWHGQAPRIINTFLERGDFDGKTVIPFCTSGSSGVGSSDTSLHSLCPDSVIWLPGERFGASASETAVAQWVRGLDIVIER